MQLDKQTAVHLRSHLGGSRAVSRGLVLQRWSLVMLTSSPIVATGGPLES